MSPSTILYLLATLSVFFAERVFGTDNVIRYPLLLLGAGLAAAAVGRVAAQLSRHRKAAGAAVGAFALSASSFGVYLLSTFAGSLSDDKETVKHLQTALQALTPLVWALGAFPAFSLDRTLTASPHSVHPRRMRTAIEGGLALALGLSMLFPFNWLATEFNKRWDFGFFRTTSVGSSTRSLVDTLPEPVRVVLFYPPSSEVLRELRPYFADLEGANLTVEATDAALVPELAKEWRVRDNGTIVIAKGEQVETIRITDKLDAARKDLRKLDSKVQTALLKLARNKKTAYFTVGHEELFWKNAPSDEENVDILKKVLEGFNFKVKELGLDDGLANAIPDDAALVVIAGPKKPFLAEEIAALTKYRDQGGSLMVMRELGAEPDAALDTLSRAAFQNVQLLSDKNYMRKTGGPADQALVITNKYSSHESLTTLSKNASQAILVFPGVGGIVEQPGPGKYTATVRAMPEWWADLNGDFAFNADSEKRGGAEVAAVISGPATEDGKEWRIAAVGDATWASNYYLRNPANVQYFADTVAWLSQDPALSGEVENEEDVKIQHTQGQQAVWFYGTTVLVPVGVIGFGVLRVRMRRGRRGEA